ncbi:hypothetical protein [Roseomonas fluvialis]|uniref:Uncharacterized protein n=1 Tax=Roseomonas fluvialis TaxID=1750527 RepID=A0ABM7YAP5_9PROT|nr:hypothetical protein [Roseomonas fluvialis]BDG75104.1 hypothetical protein Rmf_50330 [Roseomonas fluvialis]
MRTALIAALLVPVAAAAQPALPTRDVSVQYGIAGAAGNGPQIIHMSFDAGAQRMRFDAPGTPGYSVVDHGTGQSITTVDPAGAAVQVPMPPSPPGRLPNGGAVAQGQGSLNGTPCTVWSFAASGSTICVGDDGVPLYGDGTDAEGRPRRFAATRVEYGPPSAAPPVLPPAAPIERRALPPSLPRGEYLPGLGYHYGAYHFGGGYHVGGGRR